MVSDFNFIHSFIFFYISLKTSFFSRCNASDMLVRECFNEAIAFPISVNTLKPGLTGLPACVDACLQPARLSPDPKFHLSA